jgi:hypothetical protein
MLLHALVEVTLDAASIRIGSENEPLPRRSQFLGLLAQPVERFA